MATKVTKNGVGRPVRAELGHNCLRTLGQFPNGGPSLTEPRKYRFCKSVKDRVPHILCPPRARLYVGISVSLTKYPM